MLLDALAYLTSHPIRCIGTVLAIVFGLFAFGHWIDRPDSNKETNS